MFVYYIWHLKDGVDFDEFLEFYRREAAPQVRSYECVDNVQMFAVEDPDDHSPWQFIERIEISDYESWHAATEGPENTRLHAKFASMVDDSKMVQLREIEARRVDVPGEPNATHA